MKAIPFRARLNYKFSSSIYHGIRTATLFCFTPLLLQNVVRLRCNAFSTVSKRWQLASATIRLDFEIRRPFKRNWSPGDNLSVGIKRNAANLARDGGLFSKERVEGKYRNGMRMGVAGITEIAG